MAYTANQTVANVIATVQGVNPAINADAITNALSGLASGYVTPIGSPILLGGVLVKCTAGFASAAETFSTDAAPA
jgi:hypothetical protein